VALGGAAVLTAGREGIMSRILALVWKEWRESRWFTVAGLALFPGFLAAMVIFYRWGIYVSPDAWQLSMATCRWTLSVSGAFAILFGVALGTADFRRGIETFWRSRPIGLTSWWLAKVGVGLALLLAITLLPLVIILAGMSPFIRPPEVGTVASMGAILRVMSIDQVARVINVVIFHSATLVFLFLAATVLGLLIRRAAQAAMLALAVGLLVYFLPVIAPPLEWLNVFRVLDSRVAPAVIVTDLPEVLAIRHGSSPWHLALSSVNYAIRGGGIATAQAELVLVDWGLAFLATMAAGSLVLIGLGWLAVRRGWRLRFDLKLMSWLLGLVLLVLFSTFAWQVGSNLEPRSECLLTLPENELSRGAGEHGGPEVLKILPSEDRGLLVLGRTLGWGTPEQELAFSLCRFEVKGDRVILGPETVLERGREAQSQPYYDRPGSFVWTPARPNRALEVGLDVEVREVGNKERPEQQTKFRLRSLMTLDLDAPPDKQVINTLDLRPYQERFDNFAPSTPCFYRDRIYLSLPSTFNPATKTAMTRYLVIDVKDPDAPRVIDQVEAEAGIWTRHGLEGRPQPGERERFREASEFLDRIVLPPLPGLSPRERFDVASQKATQYQSAREGDLWARIDQRGLTVYHVALDETEARFEVLSYQEWPALARFLGYAGPNVVLNDGFLYVKQGYKQSGLTVYDLRDPRQPSRVGHFARPDGWSMEMAPLANGRVLVGSNQLYLFTSPRGR
jgi:hypothetical protein